MEIGSKAPVQDIYIEQGTDWEYSFRIASGGDPVDLTGYVFRGQIRKTRLSATIVKAFTFTVTVAADGTCVARLTAADTADIVCGELDTDPESIYVYDWELVNPSARVRRIMQGTAYISAEATK